MADIRNKIIRHPILFIQVVYNYSMATGLTYWQSLKFLLREFKRG